MSVNTETQDEEQAETNVEVEAEERIVRGGATDAEVRKAIQAVEVEMEDGLEEGTVVRHTLFDRYDEPLYAQVEEVVGKESRHVGGHVVLSHPEWEDTREALLENVEVALEAEPEYNTRFEGPCDCGSCEHEFDADEEPSEALVGDGDMRGMAVPLVVRFCSDECFEEWLAGGCEYEDTGEPRAFPEW